MVWCTVCGAALPNCLWARPWSGFPVHKWCCPKKNISCLVGSTPRMMDILMHIKYEYLTNTMVNTLLNCSMAEFRLHRKIAIWLIVSATTKDMGHNRHFQNTVLPTAKVLFWEKVETCGVCTYAVSSKYEQLKTPLIMLQWKRRYHDRRRYTQFWHIYQIYLILYCI